MKFERSTSSISARRLALSGLAAATAMLAQPSLAQDSAEETSADQEVVFPEGSIFGIIPFEGATEAAEFTGFADLENSATVMINEIPLEGWDELLTNFSQPSVVARAGITASSIEELVINGMPALRIAGTQTMQGSEIPKCLLLVKGSEKVGFLTAQIPFNDNFDGDACAMIKGVAERPKPTLTDQLSALPFALNDLGGMRISQVMGGSSVVLTKGPLDLIKASEQPALIVASSIAPSALGVDRMQFSERALQTLVSYSPDATIESAEFVFNDLPATRIIKTGTDSETDEDVRLVQWVVFKPDGNYIRLIGISAADQWADTYPNFSTVFAGLEIDAAAP
ncbi:hypothetical protein [Erythrobacter sp. F6033]|uniref:hypothetical protein n=1 Tax=Erythrobacter sp. F6033 TaxID=2926401 RepID=UPI001FF59C1A|nr:hypothetical protein [Erythrobacter sp. F6033]MCK0127885.1 hypothetical protein [Erythrobacter sp. F6033]